MIDCIAEASLTSVQTFVHVKRNYDNYICMYIAAENINSLFFLRQRQKATGICRLNHLTK